MTDSAEARYPYPAPISAYGNGGFRFADMSHRGSILCLPSGIHAWSVTGAHEATAQSFAAVFTEAAPPDVILFGTGVAQVWPDAALTEAFARAGIGLEVMNTGSAARTYNILLAERRNVGAALIAVP